MENRQTSDKKFKKFTWTIKNFSKLNTKKLYSDTFVIGGHPWRILIFPKGNYADYLSIYLDACRGIISLPEDWSRFENFKLALINQVSDKWTITKEFEHQFIAREADWGSTSFVPLADLHKSNSGFLVNDTCVVEVQIAVGNPVEQVNQPADQVVSTTPAVSSEPIGNVANPLPKEFSVPSCGELVDFKSFGKIEEAFVPLLEEVCSLHPSLIDCQRKRSRRFTEWAFTALGRVLHFLKTKKMKDMNKDACRHLQNLWEELETCKFDLTWLQPHIQSTLSKKSCIENALKLKTMQENVDTLNMEIKLLWEKLISAKVDIEKSIRELAQEGFEEKDLDVELGYGVH